MKLAASLCRIAGLLAVFFVGLVMYQDRLLYFPESAPLAARPPVAENGAQAARGHRPTLFAP